MGAPEGRDIGEQLRAAGHRVTRPRQLVWAALRDSRTHLTVDQVAARVQSLDPGVNVASVYRSLTLFEELDLVRQSRLGADPANRWELAHPDEHFHLVCRECGSIDHHRGTLVQAVRDHLAGDHHFTADTVELTVTGTCGDCHP